MVWLRKTKIWWKSKIAFLDTDSFIVHIKENYIHKGNAEDVETRFDTSNYEFNGILLNGRNKKINSVMKDELGGKIIIKFV